MSFFDDLRAGAVIRGPIAHARKDRDGHIRRCPRDDFATHERRAQTAGALDILVLSIWCGTLAGLLEVCTIVLRKRFV